MVQSQLQRRKASLWLLCPGRWDPFLQLGDGGKPDFAVTGHLIPVSTPTEKRIVDLSYMDWLTIPSED